MLSHFTLLVLSRLDLCYRRRLRLMCYWTVICVYHRRGHGHRRRWLLVKKEEEGRRLELGGT
jgi:hypothetical protein